MEPSTGNDLAEEKKATDIEEGDIEEGALLKSLLPSDANDRQPLVHDNDKGADALPDLTGDGVESAFFTDLFFFADKVSCTGCQIIRAVLASCITFNALCQSHSHSTVH